MSRAFSLSERIIEPIEARHYERDRGAAALALREAGASVVYEIGTVRAPGISDLDLIAVFPDDRDWSRPDPVLAKFFAARPRSFLHEPWGMLLRHMRLLPSLFAVRQMRSLTDGSVWESEQSEAQRLLWNIEASASVLGLLAARAARMSARSALCVLNGITYNVDLAARAGVVSGLGAAFVRRITDLRLQWFASGTSEREHELTELWALGRSVLRELLSGYADLVVTRYGLARGAELSLKVPGANLVYCFTDAEVPRVVIAHPLAHVLALPKALGGLFELLGEPGLGLERWLRLGRAGRLGRARSAVDPAFSEQVRCYARENASYLRDMLGCRLPLLPLSGGTFAHVSRRRHARLGALLRRAGRALLPT